LLRLPYFLQGSPLVSSRAGRRSPRDTPGTRPRRHPDGLKVDSRGNIYICQFGAGRILVTRPDGTWLRTIAVPLKGVTNVAFGPDEKMLYVTAVKDAAEPYLGAVYEIPNQ
jgi:sugar lactone lactonase YvrE